MNRTLWLLVVLAAGCATWSRSSLQADYRALQKDIEASQIDEWAMKCAPRELALAESNHEFATLEFAEGDARRGSEHLKVAKVNIAIALEKAEACRPKDRDGDGITDEVDQCPDEPEDFDGDEDEDGCPEFDRDGDGIADDVDACPDDPEDKDGWEDTDGCPDLDNDKDGILDASDACPDVPENIDGYMDTDGCPEEKPEVPVDTDGDGYTDDVDGCPTEPENFNEYLDEDGCPDVKPQNVKITKDRIEISQTIYFEVNKTVIKPVSYGILNEVAQVLKDYPKVHIRVEGHTDSDGSDEYNLTLSQGRAASVMGYLVGQGVDASRMVSEGFGESRPIDTNRTKEGKANNRRVEFHITEGM